MTAHYADLLAYQGADDGGVLLAFGGDGDGQLARLTAAEIIAIARASADLTLTPAGRQRQRRADHPVIKRTRRGRRVERSTPRPDGGQA